MARYDDSYYGFRPYVPRAERRAKAMREVRKLEKKGRTISPIEIQGRKIATTFWGTAWCDNLEGYSDFENRLPRGRTYVRNGSVLDLQIGAGRVDALVSGSEIYEVRIKVAGVPAPQWRAICQRSAGGIDSLVELLQGRFSKGVMAHLCRQGTGLFPTPREIEFRCSCPDWASMCKHVAAVLYGVGARLDEQPELLFRLRQVNEQDLLAHAGADLPLAKKKGRTGKVLAGADLGEVFGVELTAAPAASATPPAGAQRRREDAAATTPAMGPTGGRRKDVKAPGARTTTAASAKRRREDAAAASAVVQARGRRKREAAPASEVPPGKTDAPAPPPFKASPRASAKLSAAARERLSERMRRYWAERRAKKRQ